MNKMEDFMKKKKQFLSIVLMIFLSTLCISCKKGLYAEEHKFLYNKMSEITVEDDKYYLDYDEENGITYRKNSLYSFILFHTDYFIILILYCFFQNIICYFFR